MCDKICICGCPLAQGRVQTLKVLNYAQQVFKTCWA